MLEGLLDLISDMNIVDVITTLSKPEIMSQLEGAVDTAGLNVFKEKFKALEGKDLSEVLNAAAEMGSNPEKLLTGLAEPDAPVKSDEELLEE
jgi:hypothetical protein